MDRHAFLQSIKNLPPRQILGRTPSRPDRRTLRLSDYLPLGKLPPLYRKQDYLVKVPDPCGAMLNDQLGDCVIAGYGHAIQGWTGSAASEQTIPDSSILAGYEAVGGYVPGEPNTDQGCDMLSAAKYWRSTGLVDCEGKAHKIDAFASVDIGNLWEIRYAIQLFGGFYAGWGLPNTAQNQTTWWVVQKGGSGAPYSWGGHCTWVGGFNVERNVFILKSWGDTYYATLEFMLTYMDEGYALISKDFLDANGVSPSELNLAQMDADLGVVTAPRGK